jgi:hypothetical protein
MTKNISEKMPESMPEKCQYIDARKNVRTDSR